MGKIDCKPLRSRGENKKNGIFGIYKLLQNLRFKNMTIPQAFYFPNSYYAYCGHSHVVNRVYHIRES